MTEHKITVAAFDLMFEGEKSFYDTPDPTSLLNGEYDDFLDDGLEVGNGTQTYYDFSQPADFDIFCGEIQPTATVLTPASLTSSVPSFNSPPGSYELQTPVTLSATKYWAHRTTSFALGSSPTHLSCCHTPFMAPPPPAINHLQVTTSALMEMAIQFGVSDDSYFPVDSRVAHDATTSTTYPEGSFPSSDFTFSVAQPPYPSNHSGLIWPPTMTSTMSLQSGVSNNIDFYAGSNAIHDATTSSAYPSGAFPTSNSTFSIMQPPYQSNDSGLVWPPSSHFNPQSYFDYKPPTEYNSGPALEAPTGVFPSSSSHHSDIGATKATKKAQEGAISSRTWHKHCFTLAGIDGLNVIAYAFHVFHLLVQDEDGCYRCLLCTAEPVFTDTEKDIVRHLGHTEVHHPEKVCCLDTIYRCPCGKGILGKRKDTQKRHVRTYITREQNRAILSGNMEQLDKVNAYEAWLKSEKLL
ncbi:unnamed protein product [Cyclocybe aegerita]|uniref:Uncharacterized protein n=1 Tax=Cyclocybe aegerita TaxID=1973307 RepID=A0A8S0W2N3_CYCAE|nr:unnamed protein product [Cyclocybe aegerita]